MTQAWLHVKYCEYCAMILVAWLLTVLQSSGTEMKKTTLNRMHYVPKGPWALSLTVEAETHCIQAWAKPVLNQKPDLKKKPEIFQDYHRPHNHPIPPPLRKDIKSKICIVPTLFKIWLNGSLIQKQKWGKSYNDNNKNSDDNDRQQTISIR